MNTTLWYIPQRRSWVKPPAVTRELLKLNPAGARVLQRALAHIRLSEIARVAEQADARDLKSVRGLPAPTRHAPH